MASRRDELNAYTFAKRRMLAAFVQPSATGSEENAPRPLRSVVPSVIIAVVILAAFGAWGMIKPTAPQDWDTPGEKVIIASDSTTRYVVLKTDGKVQLHPVLNMASAKLLLDPDKGEVIKVDESVLDNGDIPHGVTIGIPYAPDRLPDKDEAKKDKRWAVCQRPAGKESGTSIQKAAFVFASSDKGYRRIDASGRLKGGEVLYVQGPDKTLYLVDARGWVYPLDDEQGMLSSLLGENPQPQQVSKEWLATLHLGDKIGYPTIEGAGMPANVGGQLDEDASKVGTVLKASVAGADQFYVVLRSSVAPVSDFMAQLLLGDSALVSVNPNGQPRSVNRGAITASTTPYGGDKKWPENQPKRVNDSGAQSGATNTICNVLRSVDGNSGAMTLSTWAGTAFPAALPTGSSSAYVTPGSGQLFREFTGSNPTSGPVFLVTDTGLRYVLQANGDSSTEGSCVGGTSKNKEQQSQEARQRLGYENVKPDPIPDVWSRFLPTGPGLSTAAACQPQGS